MLHCLYLLLDVLVTLPALQSLQEDGHCQAYTFGLGLEKRTSQEVSKGTRGRGSVDWPSHRLRVSWFGEEKEIGVVSGNKGMELNFSHFQVT